MLLAASRGTRTVGGMSQSEQLEHRPAPRRRRHLIPAALAAVAIAVAGTGEASAASCVQRDTEANRLSQPVIARTTLCLLNAERRARGLSSLRLSRPLSRAARRHSSDMVGRSYFAHTAPGGPSLVQRVRRNGYLKSAHRWRLGENIAWGASGRSSTEAIVSAWMHSPPHRKAILTRAYRDVGVGVAAGVPSAGQAGGATYTADFGVRR
jgi:uncharacterized protein YkwD